MPEQRVRAGIMGLGRSGWNIHADALAEHQGIDVVAVADPMEERRREAQDRFGCAAYAEPEALLEDGDVELAIVATPSHTHVPLAVGALSAGKHVVVEKPMAQTAAEVDAMVDAAESADRVVTCFQNRRFDPDFVAIREVVESGRLGELVLVRRVAHRFQRRADWQTLRKFGGGELSNTTPHLMDQVLLLMADGPIELFADLRRMVSAGDAEDHVKLCLQAPTGPVGDIEASTCVAVPQPAWVIAGTTGGLVGDRDGVTVRWFDPDELGPLTLDEGAAAGRKYGTGETIDRQEEKVGVRSDGRSPALQFYDRLEATLREGAELFVTPQSVRRQIELIERARQQTGLH